MEMKDILELERKHNEQMLEAKTKQAHYENKQQTINAGISILSMQMSSNIIALFAMAFRDRK
jgi:hypothetical protein